MTATSPAYGLGFGSHQLRDFHHVRCHFFQAANVARLALVRPFSAFLVALFTEMYGFPLTIYFLSGWLQNRFPNVDWFSHDAGQMLEMMLGWKANPHLGPFHLLSNGLILAGFLVISAAWRVLYEAQRKNALATTGPYA
jgi:protein-S-isoprenylcysteine O-methyltransferase Ste14